MSITLILVIITTITSIIAFGNRDMMNRMIFSPYAIKRQQDWHRFLTSGLIHGSWLHLFFNMYVLFIFGRVTEQYFTLNYGSVGRLMFLLMYLFAIVLSEVYSFFQHKDNPYYASLGASGAVSAVLFSSILFQPLTGIGLIFFPFGIPAFIFGILYLAYSVYMARHGNDNIGHYAHFYGAIFGFIFPVILKPVLIINFFQQIQNVF